MPEKDDTKVKMGDIALQFLKIGSVGYGGPIALIALMEKELSEKRRWINAKDFQEAYLYCKLLPGPVAYQMALWIGRHQQGRLGGLVAGLTFLLPSFLLILGLSIFYQKVTG